GSPRTPYPVSMVTNCRTASTRSWPGYAPPSPKPKAGHDLLPLHRLPRPARRSQAHEADHHKRAMGIRPCPSARRSMAPQGTSRAEGTQDMSAVAVEKNEQTAVAPVQATPVANPVLAMISQAIAAGQPFEVIKELKDMAKELAAD